MRVDVIMPQMGESITEGTISKWLKGTGDLVERDDPILEISTDKVDAEIPSPVTGRIIDIIHKEGATVPINEVIAVIETGPSEVGDAVSRSELPSLPSSPVTGHHGPPPAETALSTPQTEPPLRPDWAGAPASVPIGAKRRRASPLVTRIAEEHGIEINRIQGTGLDGRITKRDILKYLEDRDSPLAVEGAEVVPVPIETPLLSPHAGEQVRIEPMSVMRQRIAEHMLMSRRTSAHVSTVFEVDMTPVSRIRQHVKDTVLAREGVKLTYLPFIAKACVGALQRYPLLNASVSGDTIVYHRDINLGIAVALDWGLIVPVIRKAEEKDLLGIARSIQDLADRARQKKLKPEEVQGGTFTITNPGTFGSLFGTPIINQPQVAILGVGAINKRVVVTDEEMLAIRSMAFFSLSFDHRIIDGALADQFMSEIKKTLESYDASAV
jgi:2-oxoglutarate dehydrogenase E2 component (dihydrolipoamide succinyltransferase)